MDQQKKTLIDPKDKTFQLRGSAKPRTSVFISKIFLKKFDEVDIHALGDAISGAVRCAETLQRQGLATIQKIETLTQTLENGKKQKIIVSLKVTQDGKKRINEEIKQ
ncbi:unnamed protein product [Paramecium pentaurelia]|uniref:DNA/RNA-binding protein Alba-like domain-containing protein n=1 Tax=Paramecium pentaurelia TaxID=43138 RepID=A0A8S1VW62_9CILI|nr:unnamed protein product [Paramecium pentaurelia]